ncbi:hypothetical protein [Arenicella xantha]|uniref:Lipoprotein n=1 Tax=Arenicella xantha TaxID=644221 RepID=A0A395JT70_9GAMM|nr:hypothetical protein [Arenicella xantha]RBP52758.1 hypothetical protein DFR28_101141 [Arenicella xantha]
MNHWINKIAVAVVMLFSLSACIEERVVVKVKKDGSGLVEHYSYNNVEDAMGGFLSGLMDEQGMEGAGDAIDQKVKNEFDDQYFEDFAREMGEGVSVEKYELGNNEIGMKGYHATYAFDDINKIAVKMRESLGEGDDDAQVSDQKEALTQVPDFSMKDGVLLIKIPHEFDTNDAPTDDDMENMPPQMLGMMAAMFQGMRIAVSVEGIDDIKETNAIHRDGNTVVLTDLRMDKLMGNMEGLKKMQTLGSLPRDEMQAMANETDGIDVDMQEQIVIRF